MKWSRAVHHLRDLALTCTDMLSRPPEIYRIRVRQLWTFGVMLDAPTDLDWIPVALSVDLPAEEVPWLGEPSGAAHWANATRLSRNPFSVRWRSARAPVWNHAIQRPALLWTAEDGPIEDTLAALRDGHGARVRTAAPSAAELAARIEAELAIGLASLRACTDAYEDRRWKPGKLEPTSDALWQASIGYLDLLAARSG